MVKTHRSHISGEDRTFKSPRVRTKLLDKLDKHAKRLDKELARKEKRDAVDDKA